MVKKSRQRLPLAEILEMRSFAKYQKVRGFVGRVTVVPGDFQHLMGHLSS
jgi:hypothetical protein